MRQYLTTMSMTQTQARAVVEAWKVEQAEKQRKQKMAIWFAKGKSIQEARDAVENNF